MPQGGVWALALETWAGRSPVVAAGRWRLSVVVWLSLLDFPTVNQKQISSKWTATTAGTSRTLSTRPRHTRNRLVEPDSRKVWHKSRVRWAAKRNGQRSERTERSGAKWSLARVPVDPGACPSDGRRAGVAELCASETLRAHAWTKMASPLRTVDFCWTTLLPPAASLQPALSRQPKPAQERTQGDWNAERRPQRVAWVSRSVNHRVVAHAYATFRHSQPRSPSQPSPLIIDTSPSFYACPTATAAAQMSRSIWHSHAVCSPVLRNPKPPAPPDFFDNRVLQRPCCLIPPLFQPY